ncbi:MAG: hypothetical protein CFE23_16030 [Flavobacterium sp. BFFFF1]|uniref:hypothetical protein n=1 Tax=Flavobacterium sp. BFFFF1 TaxID=2015557 RepID=UPI000BC69841|nr:hypothetical protein [Flavobacterium sp. BFFFF1]OYU79019.1 MAG: hypothetical protein CFE23_16030 [Flavobacterium sp. BFFFF1]
MKVTSLLIFYMLFALSCKSQTKSERLIMFENELSQDAIKEYYDNQPLPDEKYILVNFCYYNYFELFGNSGAVIVYELNDKASEKLINEIKNYKRLDNDRLIFQDSRHVYKLNNENIELPELDHELGDVTTSKTPKNNDVEIYLIKKGRLKNTYNNEKRNKTEHSFSCGIYIMRNESKIIYWFLIY